MCSPNLPIERAWQSGEDRCTWHSTAHPCPNDLLLIEPLSSFEEVETLLNSLMFLASYLNWFGVLGLALGRYKIENLGFRVTMKFHTIGRM